MDINKLERIVKSDYSVYSFDLFDTVFYRKYFSLEEVLYSSSRYLSGYLSGPIQAPQIARERKYITQSLKHSTTLNTQEPKLADVLTALINNHTLTNNLSVREVVAKVMSFELSLEFANLHVIPETLKVLNQLKANAKHTICISDMYFDREQIESILEKLNIRHFFQSVFVSSDIRLSKQTGDLFDHVVRSLEVPACNILHIGDKLTTDIRPARNAGIDSKLVTFRNQPTPAFLQTEDIHHNVSLLSTAFLIDVIQRCHAEKITRIFFLSRDATTLGEICTSLMQYEWAKQYFSTLQVCHLDISRASTAFLELDWEGDKLEQIIKLYFENISGRGLDDFLNYFDISPFADRQQLADIDKSSWANHIRQHDTSLELQILDQVKRKNQTVIDYLHQADAIHAGSVAFVDIGYAGSIATRISHYLTRQCPPNTVGSSRIHCFFLLSNNLLAANALSASPIAEMNRPGFLNRHPIPPLLRGNGAWLEVFYQDASRGPLLNYERSGNGNIVATFLQPTNSISTTEIQKIRQLTSLITNKQLILLSSKFQSGSIREYFLHEMAKPSSNTVISLQYCEYLSGGSDQSHHSLITSVSSADLLPHNIQGLINNDHWLSGSLQHSGKGWVIPLLSVNLDIYYKLKQLLAVSRNKVRSTLSRYGVPIANKIIAFTGIIKAKRNY